MASNNTTSIALGNSSAGQNGRRSSNRRLDFSRTPQVFIRIEVGVDPQKETFHVPKNVLCYHSPFFDAALNSPLKEGLTNSMILDDVDATVFALMISYMTTGQISHREKDYVGLLEFAKLWTLASRFLIPRLQNLCADSMLYGTDIKRELEVSGATVQSKMDRARDVIKHAFETQTDTPLRRLCVAKFLHMVASLSMDHDLAREMVNHCLQDTPARGVLHLLLQNLWKHRAEIMDTVDLRKESYHVEEN